MTRPKRKKHEMAEFVKLIQGEADTNIFAGARRSEALRNKLA